MSKGGRDPGLTDKEAAGATVACRGVLGDLQDTLELQEGPGWVLPDRNVSGYAFFSEIQGIG